MEIINGVIYRDSVHVCINYFEFKLSGYVDLISLEWLKKESIMDEKLKIKIGIKKMNTSKKMFFKIDVLNLMKNKLSKGI